MSPETGAISTRSCNRRSGNYTNPVTGVAESDAARFWSKVEKTDSCWLWRGYVNRGTGYGQFTWAARYGAHRPVGTHRVAWEMTHGPIPAKQSVLHHCDTPLCVNPEHLFLGTQKDNMTDAANKGRLHVPRPGRQTVSDEAVSQIRALAATGAKQIDLARQFGVTKAYVSLLLKGQRRRHQRELVHGTTGSYTSRGCRCDLCRSEWARYCREYRQKKRARGECAKCSNKSESYLCDECRAYFNAYCRHLRGHDDAASA